MRISPETGFTGVGSKQTKHCGVGGGKVWVTELASDFPFSYCLQNTPTQFTSSVKVILNIFPV